MNYYDRLKQLERILDDNNVYLGDITFESVDYDMDEVCWALQEEGIYFEHGATRGCFYFSDEDYVFKFDFFNLECSYCETEADFYQEAKKKHLEKVFLPMERFDELCGATIYIQDKAHYGFHHFDILTEEEEHRYSKLKSSSALMNQLPLEWIKAFVSYYGEELFKDFELFIDNFGINDLHEGNIGIDEKGRPYIFDYAGFFE